MGTTELEATKKALVSVRRQATKSKAAAQAYLQGLGIYAKDGQLTERFSSLPKKPAA